LNSPGDDDRVAAVFGALLILTLNAIRLLRAFGVAIPGLPSG
jgi:hypothetical protein